MLTKTLDLAFLNLEDILSKDVCFFVVQETRSEKIHWDLAGYLLVAEDPIEGILFGNWIPKTKQEILGIWESRSLHRTGILLNCKEKVTIEFFKSL